MTVKPIDPTVSIYPLPMSPRRARHEAHQARRWSLILPKGHPYRVLPTWVPYPLARVLAAYGL